jgi:hypothetical protein
MQKVGGETSKKKFCFLSNGRNHIFKLECKKNKKIPFTCPNAPALRDKLPGITLKAWQKMPPLSQKC